MLSELGGIHNCYELSCPCSLNSNFTVWMLTVPTWYYLIVRLVCAFSCGNIAVINDVSDACSINKFMNTKLVFFLNYNANINFNGTCFDSKHNNKMYTRKNENSNKSVMKHAESKMHKLYIEPEIQFWCAKKGSKQHLSHFTSLKSDWIGLSKAPKEFFLLNRAWLGHNSVTIKTSFTKLTINFILNPKKIYQNLRGKKVKP
jgi:hypothetical protein